MILAKQLESVAACVINKAIPGWRPRTITMFRLGALTYRDFWYSTTSTGSYLVDALPGWTRCGDHSAQPRETGQESIDSTRTQSVKRATAAGTDGARGLHPSALAFPGHIWGLQRRHETIRGHRSRLLDAASPEAASAKSACTKKGTIQIEMARWSTASRVPTSKTFSSESPELIGLEARCARRGFDYSSYERKHNIRCRSCPRESAVMPEQDHFSGGIDNILRRMKPRNVTVPLESSKDSEPLAGQLLTPRIFSQTY